MPKGLIISNVSNLYEVKIEDKIIECKPMGKIKQTELTPVVGDYVEIETIENEPNKGMIITPGGGIELFEKMEDTVKREIMEETGLEITNIKQLGTYEIINNPDEHRIIIYWSADYNKNSVHSATDLLDAKFYTKEEIKELDKLKKLSSITKQVLSDNSWL